MRRSERLILLYCAVYALTTLACFIWEIAR